MQMALQRQTIQIRNQLIPALDRLAQDVRDGRVHPELDDVAAQVVGGGGLEAVYGEAGAVGSELDPAREEFGAGLWAFEAADVVAVALCVGEG